MYTRFCVSGCTRSSCSSTDSSSSGSPITSGATAAMSCSIEPSRAMSEDAMSRKRACGATITAMLASRSGDWKRRSSSVPPRSAMLTATSSHSVGTVNVYGLRQRARQPRQPRVRACGGGGGVPRAPT